MKAFVLSILTAGVASSAVAEPWAQHASRLPTLAKKIEDNEKEIKSLIEQKNHTENPSALHDIVRSLAEKHKTLAETSAEYETERLHVRFKHPDRAAVVDRQYVHYKLKTIDELANEVGLDGRLDRLKAKVIATFPTPAPVEKTKSDTSRKPAAVDDEDAPERIHLEK